ncbi:hypothetical protein F383_11901 [Gossypium arboreum]|uniref:Uncharacterized protein n=1 Tax=Gossypium arboreum TaxID=29729 RepID=A0A0B0NFA3_GOSAR|nr:hypothetical protein F383_11901 [Gossypium arboreum]
MFSSPPLKSSQAFSSPVESRSLGHRRWSRRHRCWPPHMVAGSSKGVSDVGGSRGGEGRAWVVRVMAKGEGGGG